MDELNYLSTNYCPLLLVIKLSPQNFENLRKKSHWKNQAAAYTVIFIGRKKKKKNQIT